MTYKCFLFLFFIVAFESITAQNIRVVPAHYSTIQSALNACRNGDVISVGEGVYYENLTWPRNVNGIKLIAQGRRDSTIIDGRDSSRVINIWNWNSEVDIDSTTVIQGFTIRNGYTEGDDAAGSGIYIFNASPVLRDLKIENNKAVGGEESAVGGGIFLNESNSRIQNCTLRNNACTSDSRAHGGGLYVREGHLLIENSVFQNNLCESGKWAYGGAVKTWESPISFVDCSFIGNTTLGWGWSYGAGLHLDGLSDSKLYYKIERCKFIENHARGSRPYGCAIDIDRSMRVDIVNSIFLANKNSTVNWRGSLIKTRECELNITNCTFAYNDEGIEIGESLVSLTNSILWNNGLELDIDRYRENYSLIIDNCLIKGGSTQYNVLDVNPRFYGKYDLRLKRESPCLGYGNPDIQIDEDILGNPRPMPPGSNADIGAYEMNYLDAIISISKEDLDFEVYPNPSTGEFYFSKTFNEVKVFSPEGHLILVVNDSNKIELYNFPAAEYYAVFNNSIVKKLILTN